MSNICADLSLAIMRLPIQIALRSVQKPLLIKLSPKRSPTRNVLISILYHFLSAIVNNKKKTAGHSLEQRRIRLQKQIFQIKYGSRTQTELI